MFLLNFWSNIFPVSILFCLSRCLCSSPTSQIPQVVINSQGVLVWFGFLKKVFLIQKNKFVCFFLTGSTVTSSTYIYIQIAHSNIGSPAAGESCNRSSLRNIFTQYCCIPLLDHTKKLLDFSHFFTLVYLWLTLCN